MSQYNLVGSPHRKPFTIIGIARVDQQKISSLLRNPSGGDIDAGRTKPQDRGPRYGRAVAPHLHVVSDLNYSRWDSAVHCLYDGTRFCTF